MDRIYGRHCLTVGQFNTHQFWYVLLSSEELANQKRGLSKSMTTWQRIYTEDKHLLQFFNYWHIDCPKAWAKSILDMADKA